MTNVLVFCASPNRDGLTAACAEAAAEGARAGGAEVEEVRLNDLSINKCKVCNRGHGTCATQAYCELKDDFQALHARTIHADAYVLVTPVYWGEMSEPAMAFTDRIRRCEAPLGEDSRLEGKPVIAVAAAGGSGNGMITCLLSMERWIDHVRARKFDLIGVNQWSREYKLAAIRSAADMMSRGL
jgi:multimeric flavodoxin WrbA